jgi:hypothetical protein
VTGPREQRTEILVVGGGVGGCAAALAAAARGQRVILTEESAWIGGQLTAQAVPPDEHGWIESFGCTAAYRRFREGVRRYYRDHYPLTAQSRALSHLNPGNGWVSPLCHEPRVALAVLEAMLAPHESSGRLRVLRRHRAIGVEPRAGDRVGPVHLRSAETGAVTTVEARYVLDATELGDLLPLSGTEHVTGRESSRQTGERSAPEAPEPGNVQAFSVCFALDHLEGEVHTIEPPARYGFWRSYVPAMRPPWPGRLLSWTALNPRSMEPIQYRFDPHREAPRAFSGLWSYRRILDRSLFEPGAFPSDICLVNWPMIDYWLGDLCGAAEAEGARHLEEARQLSLSVVHWLQTEAPRPDGGQGWPGLRLRPDVTGTADGLAQAPYIRESRRIRAVFTVCEQHVAAAARPGARLAEPFPDSVGVGYYRIDLHPSTGGDNYVDVGSLPFRIPLGALVPVRVENLLPAAKNLGTTHITNGCYRLHPVEWNIGEAAGALAVFCLERGSTPRAVLGAARLTRDFQDELSRHGVELGWPEDLDLDAGDPHAHAR